MGQFTAYAITVAIIFAAEYIAYRLLMSGTTLHRQNRAAILACYAIALSLPFALPFLCGLAETMPGQMPETPLFGVMPTHEMAATSSNGFWKIALIAYMGGAICLAIQTIASLAKIWRLIKGGKRSYATADGVVVVVSPKPIAPFCWGKHIVVNEADSRARSIIEHEMMHARFHHTADMIIAQAFIIFNWFNPFAYMMRSRLSAVHEYEVDEAMLAEGFDPKEYQLLIIRHAVRPERMDLANNLSHNQLKTRIIMMKKKKTSGLRRFAAALIMPAALIGAILTQSPAVASATASIADASLASPAAAVTDTASKKDQIVVVSVKGMKKTPGDSTASQPTQMYGVVNGATENVSIEIDGKSATEEDMRKLDPNDIACITVLKEPEKIIITTKKASETMGTVIVNVNDSTKNNVTVVVK